MSNLPQNSSAVTVPVDGGTVTVNISTNIKTGMSSLNSLSYTGVPYEKKNAKKTVVDLLVRLRRERDIIFLDDFHVKKHFYNALRCNAIQI